mgnify:CR=1 FL=1
MTYKWFCTVIAALLLALAALAAWLGEYDKAAYFAALTALNAGLGGLFK